MNRIDRLIGRLHGDRTSAVAVGALTGVVAILLLLTALALDTLSAARAYIAAESLWSKAEKAAIAHLVRYADTRNEGDYDAFLQALRIPLGDRLARLELAKPQPNPDIVRLGLLEGGNHPDDVERMSGVIRHLGRIPRVARALELWEQGDQNILRLIEDGAELHALLGTGAPDEAEIERLLGRLHARASRLPALQTGFSAEISAAAREAQRVLFSIVAGTAFLLLLAAIVVVRASARRTRASEDSLRQSEAKTRAVLDTMEDGYYELDLDGRFVFASAGLCRVFMRAPHEIVGHSLQEFFDPGTVSPLLETLGAVRRSGEATRTLTAALMRGDGERRIVEGSASLLRASDGAGTGFCGVLRDVTERLQREEAVHRSEAEYRALFQNAPYGIYRSTPDGRLLAVNSALVDMLGYDSAEELMATSLADGIYTNPAERNRLMHAHLEQDQVSDVEVEWRRKDGTPVLLRLNGRHLRDEDAFYAYEMFVEDITQRRSLEAELHQAQKMQAVGQLTGGIAHDFNNLLTIIASTADLLSEDLPAGAEGATRDLRELRAAAERGAEMVRKLLAFSRRGQLRMSVVDLGVVVRDSVAMLRRILPAHIEIAVDIPDPAPLVRGDPGALEQILLNLATNARDAMPEGGSLRIRAGRSELDAAYCAAHGGGRPGPYAVLVVQDTGMGMDAQTRARAFEPFFTTKPPGAGTGLGMAMIYGLVRQHDGFIDLDSEPGRGTTLRIHIPATSQPPATRETRAAPERPRGHETILFVEDEPAILGTGRRVLERHGYTVLTATNGEEALALFRARASEIDLVLSDVVMPRMGGAALYRTIQASGVPARFLFTSGYTEREVGGMLDPRLPLVAKPWSVDELLHGVRQALDTPVAARPVLR